MPTYGPGSHTYTVPSGINQIEVIAEGAGGGGGAGGDEESNNGTGGDGGAGGYLKGDLSVTPGEQITIEVGGGGGGGVSRGGGGSGGSSPWYSGGSGGDSPLRSGGGGGGGGATRIVRESSSTTLAVAEAGGGGGGGNAGGTGGSGGGGGARGGNGGSLGANNLYGNDGQNAAGSGSGGNGGKAGDQFDLDGHDAEPGGASASGLSGASTSTGGGRSGGNGRSPGTDGNSGSDAVVTINQPPSTPSISVSNATSTSVTVDIGDAIAEDSASLEYRNADNAGWSTAANYYAGEIPVVETVGGLSNGTTYEFRVNVSNSLGSATTNTVSQRTDLPAPTSISVTSTSIVSISIEWTANHSNNETRIDYRTSSAGSWTTDQTVNAGVESTTIDELQPNQSYEIRVVAVTDETSAAADLSANTEPLAPIFGALDAGVQGEMTASWSLQDDSTGGNVEVYRSTDGSLGSVVTTITDPQSQTSYTDTAVLDGTTYHYTIRRNAEGASADSGQESATTVLPKPDNLAAVDARDEEIDLEWTLTHNTGQTRVEYKPTDDATWTVSETVSRTTSTVTISGLRNGEQYDTRVVAETNEVEASSQADQAITTLPDENQPVLGNGVEDEVAVDRETATTNNGSVRIQIRETGTSTWGPPAAGFAEFIGAYDTLSMEFVGREDGEEYEVRARTETEHRTGAWTETLSIVTQFPGLANLSAAATEPTAVLLAWDDLADNEDGFTVEARREYAGGFGRWQEIANLPPDAESYTADAPPDTTVEYRTTTYTPYASVSQTVSTTTPSIGLAPRGVRASGWHVEITRPDSKGVVEPTVLDGVTLNPRLSDKPEVVVPVPLDEQWLDERWERQPVRVWRDGERLPVERLINAEISRGGGSNRVQLYLRGGHDLDARYEDEVRDRSAHNVMRDVLEASGYAYKVDPAPASEGEPFGTLTDAQDFAELADVDEFGEPVAIDNGIEPQRTAYMTPLDEITAAGVEIVSDTTVGWTASNALEFPITESRSSTWSFEADYSIPSEHVGIRLRASLGYEGFAVFYLDGDFIGWIGRQNTSSRPQPEWVDPVNLFQNGTVDELPDLDEGSHTMTIEVTDSPPGITTTFGPSGSFYLDVPVVFDTREWDPSNFADTVADGGDRLDGPPGVYSTQEVDLRIQPIQRTTGATLNATVSDTTNDQAIGVGPIEDDIQLNANATSIDRDFASSTREFVARLVLGGADGDQADGPNDGVEQYYTNYRTVPQSLSDLTVSYDALGSPSVTESIDNPIQQVLTSTADRANCIWELQWDADAGEPQIIVTQVGQRTSDADPTLAQYQVTKDLAREISGATVYGRTQSVEGEQFEAQSIGVDLINDNIQGGSERVYGADGTVYESVEDSAEETSGDYEMEYKDGRISVLQTGDMSLTESYFIDYDWHPVGSVERSALDFENHLVESLSALRSDAAAAEAASFLVDELDSPQWEAEVTIPQREAGFNLVDAIAPSQLPTPGDERFEIRSIDESAGEISLTLGTRLSAGQVIRQIEQTLGRTAREV